MARFQDPAQFAEEHWSEEELLPAPSDAEVPQADGGSRPFPRRIVAVAGVLVALVALGSLVAFKRPSQDSIATDGTQEKFYIQPPHCQLTASVNPGDTIIEAGFAGLTLGDWIMVGETVEEGERRRVTGFVIPPGSIKQAIRVDLPLERPHAVGAHCDHYNRPYPPAGPPQAPVPPATVAPTPAWHLYTKQPTPPPVQTDLTAAAAVGDFVLQVAGEVFTVPPNARVVIQPGTDKAEVRWVVMQKKIKTNGALTELVLHAPCRFAHPAGTPVQAAAAWLPTSAPEPAATATKSTAVTQVGATQMDIASTAGFTVGQHVVVGLDTASAEVRYIIAVGSPMVFDAPLKYEHPVDTEVQSIPSWWPTPAPVPQSSTNPPTAAATSTTPAPGTTASTLAPGTTASTPAPGTTTAAPVTVPAPTPAPTQAPATATATATVVVTVTTTTAPATAAPATEAPATEAPATLAPATEAPATAAPTTTTTTEAPTTEALATEAPATAAATTEAPTTEAPTTKAATTEAPTTEAPTTEAATQTHFVTTEAPTTEAPTTKAATTEAPTTEAPTTEAATTEAPATAAPATEAPATAAPTTEAPATEASATEAPATAAPATVAPATAAPTTTTTTTTTVAPTAEVTP